MTATWSCRECGDGPFHSGELDGHVQIAHGHPLGPFDFLLTKSTAVKQRPVSRDQGDEPPRFEDVPLF